MSNSHFICEDPKWYQILALPQLAQGDPKWLNARKNKQSSSDFAAVVPLTKEYIGHIIEMWNYEEKDESGIIHRPFVYNADKTCYDFSYSEYIKKKAYPYDRNEDGSLMVGETEEKMQQYGGAAEIGHRFENIIRNLTSQHLHRYISEVGWVEEMRCNNAGVSPDGIVHIDLNVEKGIGHHYHFYPDHNPLSRANNGALTKGLKNFEAKTIVSRDMIGKVPIKYHIQVERTAYELHLKSSIYTEARFLELCEKDWLSRSHLDRGENDHFKYGILLFCTASKDVEFNEIHGSVNPEKYETKSYLTGETWHCWPHAFIKTKQQFLAWRDSIIQRLDRLYGSSIRVIPVYFELEAFWCVEIPLWEKYDEIYGPLIKKEAERLHYLSQTSEGRIKYDLIYNTVKPELVEKVTRKRTAKPTLFLEDMSKVFAF